jgi:hypothetical protein
LGNAVGCFLLYKALTTPTATLWAVVADCTPLHCILAPCPELEKARLLEQCSWSLSPSAHPYALIVDILAARVALVLLAAAPITPVAPTLPAATAATAALDAPSIAQPAHPSCSASMM